MRLSPARLALLATTVASFFAPARAVAEEPWTLARYVAEATARAPDAREAEAALSLERARVAGAGLWSNPRLRWDHEAAADAGGQDVLALELPLVLSGRLGLEGEAAAAGLAAAGSRRARALAIVVREAHARWFELLTAQRRHAALVASRDGVAEHASAIAAREAAGDSAGYERLRMELELAELDGRIREAAREQARAAAAAGSFVGAEAPLAGELPGGVPSPPDELEEQALARELDARRADLAALALEETAATLSLDANERWFVPEPALTAGLLRTAPSAGDASLGWVVGVGLPLPIFARAQGASAEAEAKLAAARGRRSRALAAIRLELRARSAEVHDRRERLAHHEREVVERAERLHDIAATAYRAGAAELLVLVDAERTRRDARLTTITLAHELRAAEDDLRLCAGLWDRAPDGGTR